MTTSYDNYKIQGLTNKEAAHRLNAFGRNEIPRLNRRTDFRIFIEVIQEPMLALLMGSGIVYLLLGELKDAFILVLFCCLSIIITVIQETRTERVLEALRNLTSPRALVIREGIPRRIPGRDVVKGDIIILGEGDRVPADAHLLEAHDLQADESLLTGESVAVSKKKEQQTLPITTPQQATLSSVFSGTLIVRGTGVAEVIAIGANSEIGKVAHLLGSLEIETPNLKKQMYQFVRIFAVMGGAISFLAIVLYGLLRGGWLDAILAGIAIGMSLLPEEFPMVLTIFMAMGAWRISKARVLTRRAVAIEALGSATVLCTDKTGTLTQNRMMIKEFVLPNGKTSSLLSNASINLSKREKEILTYGVLACAPNPVDPMEKAFHNLSDQLKENQNQKGHMHIVQTYGLRSNMLAVTNVWINDETKKCTIASKGAPETIARLCALDKEAQDTVSRLVDDMGSRGLRIIAVARGEEVAPPWPEFQDQFKMTFLGLIGLADPLRPGVPEAMNECREAGIKVLMITGDYPATASAIAYEAGFTSTQVITGLDLDKLENKKFIETVKAAHIFARVTPEQKLKIVQSLKNEGEIVAMTGDGVNDAPSLKAAHIGIAMGGRGTDVAREASALVLLDDDFNSIVTTIRLGRRIYDNLKKASSFIFAVHIPIAGLALLPLILGLPIMLGPIHIAFLEMIIDPVCSLVFEAEKEEADIMKRPPRLPETPLFSRTLIQWCLIQGSTVFLAVTLIFIAGYKSEMPTLELRALVFFSLIVSIVTLIFVNRSFSASLAEALLRPNKAMIFVLIAVVLVLTFSILVPFGQNIFRFGSLHIPDIAITICTGLGIFVFLEFLKMTKVHL